MKDKNIDLLINLITSLKTQLAYDGPGRCGECADVAANEVIEEVIPILCQVIDNEEEKEKEKVPLTNGDRVIVLKDTPCGCGSCRSITLQEAIMPIVAKEGSIGIINGMSNDGSYSIDFNLSSNKYYTAKLPYKVLGLVLDLET